MIFHSRLTVEEQYWSYGAVSYLAEVGSFVGIFLGLSLFDVAQMISKLLDNDG